MTMIFNPRRVLIMATAVAIGLHMQKIKVKGQLVQKIQWKRTEQTAQRCDSQLLCVKSVDKILIFAVFKAAAFAQRKTVLLL